MVLHSLSSHCCCQGLTVATVARNTSDFGAYVGVMSGMTEGIIWGQKPSKAHEEATQYRQSPKQSRQKGPWLSNSEVDGFAQVLPDLTDVQHRWGRFALPFQRAH